MTGAAGAAVATAAGAAAAGARAAAAVVQLQRYPVGRTVGLGHALYASGRVGQQIHITENTVEEETR